MTLLRASVVLWGFLFGCRRFNGTITTDTPLDEMTDLRHLAEYPDPALTGRQFSSYDRAAKSPTEN